MIEELYEIEKKKKKLQVCYSFSANKAISLKSLYSDFAALKSKKFALISKLLEILK